MGCGYKTAAGTIGFGPRLALKAGKTSTDVSPD